ncbi:MAG: hypothetical protein EP343_16025 [Deltaproteobacteria bacterium]|nr:MAG: hypothetical protein EP343_16025 [Deltaproteobacteria bacterium]
MELDRRTLLKTTGVVAGASLLPTVACASPSAGMGLSLHEIQSDPLLRDVFAFVQAYSSKLTMKVSDLVDRKMPKVSRQCTVQAPIDSMEQFSKAWRSYPETSFKVVWCEGSNMCFQVKDTFFVLQHIPS